jgi:filamentous hemagglutinin family protein
MRRPDPKVTATWRLVRRRVSSAVLLGCTSILTLAVRVNAQAVLPQGGTVTSGQVRIGTPVGNALTINQTSSKAVVDWNSFSVGPNASVNFVQPNAGASILNRVTGTTSSTIAGQIIATGQVFLVNPNGIAITPSGSVQVGGGFVASTLDISNADFNAGNLNFSGRGASAAVGNAGNIQGAAGSFIGLIGGSVSNSGTISVPFGRVGLGAGERVTLNPTGDGFLQVAVPTGATTADGRALIDVAGRVRAAGGTVEIKAATAQQAIHDVVRVSGSVSAHSISGRSGNIVLDGGSGTVTVSGTLAANGGKRSRGGTVVVTGNKVALTATARVTADGSSGGSVLIGGDLHGGVDPAVKLVAAPVRTAATTSIADGAKISANGSTGDGGNVVIWSDSLTNFRGAIAASGGSTGQGGAVEVSSHGVLGFGGSVDVTAKSGKTGTLLLDPFDVTISASSDTSIVNGGNIFTPTGNSSILSVTSLQNALATANVTVSTGGGGAQSGNITAVDAVTWSSANSLTLNAAGAIAINAPITAISGALTLSAGSPFAAITATGAINVGSLTISQGAWSQNTANLPGLYAGSFSIGSNATFLRAAGGSGTAGSPYLLTDIYGIQGIGSSPAYIASSYKMINDIDASTTAAWNGGLGFNSIGSNSVAGYSGTFDGNNYAISNLFINRGATGTGVGMFGYASGATIQNIYLLNANVTGGSGGTAGNGSGTLVGIADNSTTVQNVSVTGTMTGSNAAGNNSNIGGIVGELNNSTLKNASAAINVTSAIGSVGGAVGAVEPGSTVQQVSATGSVSGPSDVGGLVGWAGGTITDSYATGAVSGASNVGGFAGAVAGGSISNAYSTGLVSGGNGFVGIAGVGILNNDYWNTQTSGQGSGGAGGTTGLTTAQMLTQASFSGFDFAGTWYQTAGYYPTLRGTTTILGAAPGATGGDLTVSSAADSVLTSTTTTTNINTTSLQNLLGVGNVLVSTTSGTLAVDNDVTWGSSSLRLASSGALTIGANLTSGSGGNLGLTNSAISVGGYSINLGGMLTASATASGSTTAITLSSATINVGSGTSTLSGASPNGLGVDISGTTSLTVSTGSINLSGTSTSGTGVQFATNASLTTAGSVTLSGISNSGNGLSLQGGNSITASSGNLTLSGQAPSNDGVFSQGANTLTNSGAGLLSLSGTSDGHAGISVFFGASLTTSGTVALSGLSNSQVGVYLLGTDTFTDSAGMLTISGTSTSNTGVWLNSATNTLTNSGAGVLSVSGISGTQNGVAMNSNTNLVTSGTVSLSGSSTSGSGVFLTGTNAITASAGNLTVSGTSTSSAGLFFNAGANSMTNSGAGALAISGTSSSNMGLELNTNAGLTTAGSVTLNGTSNSLVGLLFNGGNTLTASSGNLTLNGTSTSDAGLQLRGTVGLTNSGATTFTLTGDTSTYRGLELLGGASTNVTVSGNASFSGTSNTGTGFIFGSSSTFNVSSGNVTVSGLSSTASGTGAALGIRFAAASVTNSGSGSLTIAGTSNDAGTVNSGSAGVLFTNADSLTNSGGGSLSVNGTNTSGYGTELGTSTTLATSGTMSISGSSSAGYGFFMGIASSAAASTGNLTLSGNSASNIAMRLRGTSITNNGTGTLALNATGDTDLQVSISSSGGPLILSESGTMTQAAGTITAANLLLSGAGGAFTLNGPGNSIGTIAANVGSLAVTDGSALTVGTVAGTSGITASSSATLVTTGDLTIASGAPINAASPVLATSGTFVNNAGGSAVTATSGRWLIYSNTPGADSFGALDSSNTALWNATYPSLPPGSVSAAGNRYLFASQPTLTFTSTNATKTYGTDATAAIASDYSVSGYQSGVSNAFLGDNAASTFTGGPSVTSTGAAATASVAGNPYAMTILQGSLAAISGYALAFSSPGTLTVNPAPVTVTALGGSSILGSSPANPGLSAAGLQNGQGVNVLTGLYNSFGITSASKIGNYALSVGGALTNGNYTIASAIPGTWTVADLRGSITGGTNPPTAPSPWNGPSPSNPNLLVAPPSADGGSGALNGLAGATQKVNAGSESVVPGQGGKATAAGQGQGSRDASADPGRTALETGPSSPLASPQQPILSLPSSPAPVNVAPQTSANASPATQGDCGGKATGGSPNGSIALVPGNSSGDSTAGCAPQAASRKAAGVIDFALSQLNRGALLEAVGREFAEVAQAKAVPRRLFLVSLAGASIALTVGLVGWFLRSGALLSALLSSMPLWRGFDPLVVVMQPRRNEGRGSGTSEVDAMFEGAHTGSYSSRGTSP